MFKISKVKFFGVVTSVFVFHFNSSYADDSDAKKKSEDVVLGFVNQKLPSQIQLTYSVDKNTDHNAWGVDYSFTSKQTPKIKSITEAYSDKGLDLGSHGHELFAKGSTNNNSDSLSEIGASYSKRWFRLHYTKLTDEQSKAKQKCMLRTTDFDADAICTKELKLPSDGVNHFYADVNGHVKVEGNHDYSQRNHAYGFEFNVSGMPDASSWLHPLNILEYPSRLLRKKELGFNYRQLPIFTLGLEQVNPKEDDARTNLGIPVESYNRYYAQIRHTSPLGKIDGNPVKLSFNWRYFKELDAPTLIKQANLDQSKYYAIALQLPTTIIPNLKTDKSSFIISYSSGELPFGRKDEKVFEIGWRSDVDFSDILSP